VRSNTAKKILALFGDSILDNAAYTHPEPDTTAHLERQLGADWTVQRLALDGAMMHNVGEQLSALRDRPDVAVLSVGGNDAIEHIDILEQPAVTSGTVLEDLEKIGASFHTAYERVARAVAQRAARTIVCTIYEVQLEPPVFAKRVRVPLAVINDRILRVAAKLGLDTLELRRSARNQRILFSRSSPRPRAQRRSPKQLSMSCGATAGSHQAGYLLLNTPMQ